MPSYNERVGRRTHKAGSLPPGIDGPSSGADARSMSAAVLTEVAPAASQRILDDVSALAGDEGTPKQPALARLEEAIGRDFADRLVAALSDKPDSNRR
jgi:hypothetical protein